ncbi:MAG: hypothetical protein R2705_02315 [Ilumatobacteraceae bacterium]
MNEEGLRGEEQHGVGHLVERSVPSKRHHVDHLTGHGLGIVGIVLARCRRLFGDLPFHIAPGR